MKKKGGWVVFKRGIESEIFLNSTWIEHEIFFQHVVFSFFDKLLNKDRATPIPHLNLLNFEFVKKKKGGWVVFKCGIESGIFLNST